MQTALQALELLREGNKRFAAGADRELQIDLQRRDQLVNGQAPFAVILGCSDARAPAEIIFDQGLGDLFVIRVAGNIVASSHIGTVEFAAEAFGTQLVVVLGHSHCGAIDATLEQLRRPQEARSPNLQSIVDRIRPAVEPILKAAGDEEDITRKAVRANVERSVKQLSQGSRILQDLIDRKKLLVVGAEYCQESGLVDFFIGVPD